MKSKPTSGNQAAHKNTQPSSPCGKINPHQPELFTPSGKPIPHHDDGQLLFDDIAPVPEEPYVTKAFISRRFKMSYRTIERNVRDGMPSHPIGKRGVRYLVSEVQRWLDQNSRKRFAATGRAVTKQELENRICMIPILNGLEIVDGAKPPAPETPAGKPEVRNAFIPKCPPGRKRPEGPCRANDHKWKVSRYSRTCAVCGRTEDRDPQDNWVEAK